jgi:hypothetical protein
MKYKADQTEARFPLHHFAVAGEKTEKEILFLHSFAAEEICSVSLVRLKIFNFCPWVENGLNTDQDHFYKCLALFKAVRGQ